MECRPPRPYSRAPEATRVCLKTPDRVDRKPDPENRELAIRNPGGSTAIFLRKKKKKKIKMERRLAAILDAERIRKGFAARSGRGEDVMKS